VPASIQRSSEGDPSQIHAQFCIQEVPTDPEHNADDFSRMKVCMEAVVNDDIEGVGGFAIQSPLTEAASATCPMGPNYPTRSDSPKSSPLSRLVPPQKVLMQ